MCFPFILGGIMDKSIPLSGTRKAIARILNLDLFDDQWLWLHSDKPLEEEIPPWTDEDIMYICDCLLEDSLRNLFDGRCSMVTVVEIFNWMTDIKDRNPFSFVNCCLVSGLDPDEIRESVLYRLKSVRQIH
jgi:hypothetical protein